MSNRVRSLAIVLFVLALLFLAVYPVTARATKTYFTATETWVEDLSPGKESFPGGDRYHVRGAVSRFAFEASDPRLGNAEDLVIINANFRFVPEPVFVTGKMWGKFRITNEGGYWEGSWTGERDENGYSYFNYVGSGGGGYQGLKLRMRGERLNPDPTVPESFWGYIIEPGG